jgi:hypothetical protein
MRDLTDKQYADALARHGLKATGFIGYVHLPCGVGIGILGGTNRQRLAHILKAAEGHTVKPCRACYERDRQLREAANRKRIAQGKEPLPPMPPFREGVA